MWLTVEDQDKAVAVSKDGAERDHVGVFVDLLQRLKT